MKLNIDSNRFRALPGKKVEIKNLDTKIPDLYRDKEEYQSHLNDYKEEIEILQEKLLAMDRFSVLVILQGMDSCGKDSAIKHIMSGINPAGVQVFNFKRPTNEELDHDFLWRTTKCLPERGRIGIFNRSYYEEVLVARVRPEILDDYQRLPEKFTQDKNKVFVHRYEDIMNFEKFLHRNGYLILKFFLHLSKKEQKERLLERIEQPDKNWKMDPRDIEERKLWDEYMKAFEDMIEKTSSDHSPWFAIPADDKKNTRLIISSILLEELNKLDLKFPEVSGELKSRLESIKIALENE